VFDFEKGVYTADEVEKTLLMQALNYTKGNVSRAAKLIGMQRSSLRYRIERYNLDRYVTEAARR
jgi:DNA-binding protein Fis